MAADTRQAAIYFPTRAGLDPDLGEDASETLWSENLIPGIGGTPDELEMRPIMRIAGRLPSPLPARSSHASIVLNNVFYVFGGKNGSGGPMGDVWSSPDGENWTMVRLLTDWSPRYGHSVAVLSGVMYLIGGFDGTNALHDVWSSTDGATWTLIDDGTHIPFSARYYHRSGAFNSNLYVIGGRNASTGIFADVWISPDGLNWSLKETGAWSVRHSHSVVFDSSLIWVFGGQTTAGACLNDVWHSDDSGATWVEATSAAGWNARFGHVSCEVSSEVWVIAGEKADASLPNDVWLSTAIGGSRGVTWFEATAAAAFTGRAYATLHVKGSLMYLICGSAFGNVVKNEVWTSPNGADWTLLTPLHHVTGAPTRGDLYLIQPIVGSGSVAAADYVMLAAVSTASSSMTTLDAFPQLSGGDVGDIDPGNSPY